MRKSSVRFRDHILLTAVTLGFLVSLLSLLEPGVQWISSLCGFAGGSCRETAAYSLLGIRLGWWGMIYYLCLTFACRLNKSLLFWGICAGWGMEAALILIMVRDALVCPLCLFNLGVMTVLLVLRFDRGRTWQCAALVLAVYTAAVPLIKGGIKGGPEARVAAREMPDTVLARVAGREILAREIQRPLTSRIYNLEQQIYRLKAGTLDRRINRILLEKEAGEKGISIDRLKAEVTKDVRPPGQEEVDHYYRTEQYKRWGIGKGSEAEIKAQIRKLVFNSLKQKQLGDHYLVLRQIDAPEVFLEPPPVPLSEISAGSSPAMGPADAKVTIIEFSDYLCPSCKQGHDTVKKIREKYKGQLRWVFKDFPLKIHPGARDLAVAARCAGYQDEFWAFQDLLFGSKGTPDRNQVLGFADTLGLDRSRFEQCLAGTEEKTRLEKDIRSARRSGIAMTPTLIVNGRLHTGIPDFDTLSRIIDEALDHTDALQAEKED